MYVWNWGCGAIPRVSEKYKQRRMIPPYLSWSSLDTFLFFFTLYCMLRSMDSYTFESRSNGRLKTILKEHLICKNWTLTGHQTGVTKWNMIKHFQPFLFAGAHQTEKDREGNSFICIWQVTSVLRTPIITGQLHCPHHWPNPSQLTLRKHLGSCGSLLSDVFCDVGDAEHFWKRSVTLLC